MQTSPGNKGRPAFELLLSLALLFVALHPATADTVTTADIVQRSTLAGAWLSPHGRQVLYAVDQGDLATNSTRHTMWLKDVANGSAPVLQNLNGRSFEWRSDNALVYVNDAGDVVERQMKSGDTSVVLSHQSLVGAFKGEQSVDVEGIRFDTAGDNLALLVNVTDTVDPHPLHGVEVDATWYSSRGAAVGSIVRASEHTSLVIFSIDKKSILAVLDKKYALVGAGVKDKWISWSPDGQEIAFSAAVAARGEEIDSFMSSDLYVLDVASGRVRPIVTQPGFDENPRWSPDGRFIAFKTLGGVEDWRYNSQIGIVDLHASPERHWLPTTSVPEDPRARFNTLGEWSSDSRSLYYIAPVRGHYRLERLTVSNGRIDDVAVEPELDLGGIDGLAKSRNADEFLLTGQSFNHWPNLYVWSPGWKQLKQITHLNPALEAGPKINVEDVTWQNPDGVHLQGFLLSSSRISREENLPLVVDVAGGPNMASSVELHIVSVSEFPWVPLLNKGYAIFIPNTRGREGFGTTFLNLLRTDRSANRIPATDVISGVKYLIAAGRVDPHRIGIFGHSYGGGVAAFATALSNLFQAASIHEGTALILGSSDSYSTVPWTLHMMSQAEGWGSAIVPANRPLILEDSPSEFGDRIKTPTLLGFGSEDNAALQGRQYFAVLQYFNVPSEFVIYPRTGHNTTEPDLIADAYRRNLEWFDYWLRDIPTSQMVERFGRRAPASQNPVPPLH